MNSFWRTPNISKQQELLHQETSSVFRRLDGISGCLCGRGGRDLLTDLRQLEASDQAFAAVARAGFVNTWGHPRRGNLVLERFAMVFSCLVQPFYTGVVSVKLH